MLTPLTPDQVSGVSVGVSVKSGVNISCLNGQTFNQVQIFEMSRVAWRPDVLKKIIKKLIEPNMHKMFVQCKKTNKMDQFYDTIGNDFNLKGSKIRDVLKNLGKDYRSVNQKLAISGEETVEKLIRGSSELYDLFQLYQDLYYPKGSAVQPTIVVTEDGSQTLDTSIQPESLASSKPSVGECFDCICLFQSWYNNLLVYKYDQH